MSTSRREFLRVVLGASSAPFLFQLVACADDGTAPDQDTGLDPDTGIDPDAGGDTGADTVEDLPDTLPQYEYDGPIGPDSLFTHGVASGDPLTTAVIIWTRVTPEAEGDQEVWYEVSKDLAFTRRVSVGYITTGADADYTVKFDAEDLEAGRTYYYRFICQGVVSPVGRTRTAPTGDVSRLRFGVCSCSSYGHGYFHAYKGLAARNDLAAVLHLGDYIYEYGTGQYGVIREYEPANEIISLSDYRLRYAQYRRDENLAAVHRQHPIIAVWDDHETADNSYRDGAGNHSEGSEGAWVDRKAAAIQAYYEWMPIREREPGRVWRSFNYGNLADLIMLDTRLWGRDEEASRGNIEAFNDEERQLLGADQEEWLAQQLDTSTARWKVLGQQVMMGTYKNAPGLDANGGGDILNPDQWDGYRAARERVFRMIETTDPGSVIVLTGDIHSSWAHDLARDPNNPESYDRETQSGSLAVEFVTPAISSPGFPAFVADALAQQAIDTNPTCRWAQLSNRGYMVLDITPDRVQNDWYHYEDVVDPDATLFPEAFNAGFYTDWGTGFLKQAAGATEPIPDAPAIVE